MADDPSKRGSPDRDRVNMSEEHEVRYWTETFGVTRQELEVAVATIGNNVDALRQHFRKPAKQAAG